MRVFAISDLHLSFSSDKPMDVFGEAWDNHAERLADNWQDIVKEEDLVLIPGDISWAMQLGNAEEDLKFIGRLNGTKVLSKGNHDYWWSSLTRVRQILPPSMHVIQNDAYTQGNITVGAARLWSLDDAEITENGKKIYAREMERVRLSLMRMDPAKEKIMMFHYPPFDEAHADTPVLELIRDQGIRNVVYGHLHGKAHYGAFLGERDGIRYDCVSADFLKFKPLLILE